MTEADVIKQLKKDVNDYQLTVLALKAIGHELMWVDDRRELGDCDMLCFGRRMDTSEYNRKSPSATVTPDLVVQCSDTYGVVGEAKLAFSSDPSKRKRKLLALQKYDDSLVGWKTPDKRLEEHDLVLLLNHFHGPAVGRQLDALVKAKELFFKRRLAVVCFARMLEGETCLSLDLISGELASKRKTEKLADRLRIPEGVIAGNPRLESVELYDARPPLPLLMDLTHKAIVSNLRSSERVRLREEGTVHTEVEISKLRAELSECYGPGESGERVPEIPKRRWVRHALLTFEKMKWAEKLSDERYIYIVKQRRDPLEQFYKVWAKQELKRKKARDRAEAKMRNAFEKEIAEQPLFAEIIKRDM